MRIAVKHAGYGHDKQPEERVVETMEAAMMADEVPIMSHRYAGTQKIRSLRPEWKTGLLSTQAVGDLSALDADFLAVATGMQGAPRPVQDKAQRHATVTLLQGVATPSWAGRGVRYAGNIRS